MFAAERFDLKINLNQLKIFIESLEKEKDDSNFVKGLVNTSKLLSSLIQLVRDKRQLLWNLPKTLLESVILFLPYSNICILKRLCKCWSFFINKSLDISKKYFP